jgi:hypothetical protein
VTNDNTTPPATNAEIFNTAISEVITMMLERGMTTWEMAPILEEHVAWCFRPYQNPEDNTPT